MNILIFIYFFKYKTIETHARTFLPLNISALGSVFTLSGFGLDYSILKLTLPKKEFIVVHDRFRHSNQYVANPAKTGLGSVQLWTIMQNQWLVRSTA